MVALADSEIWIYVDESGDPALSARSGESRYFSLGALTVQTPITEEPINRALDKLHEDPDAQANTCDQKSLQRGYFHASFDSKNAHSHICKEIAELCPADFQFQRFDKTKVSQGRLFRSTSASFHKDMVNLVATKVSGKRIQRVNFCVAERQTFPQGVADYWKEQFLERLTVSTAELPQVPCYFPKLHVRTVPGDHPGIQAADFLLWAVSRKYGNRYDRVWYDRVGLKVESTSSESHGPFYEANLQLNNPISESPASSLVPLEYIKAPKNNPSKEELIRYFQWAKDKIQELAQKGLPTHASHLTDEVNEVANLLGYFTILPTTIKHVTSLALRLADTVPLYEPTNKQEVHFSIDAKKWLGLVYLGQEMNWVEISTLWQREHANSLQ